MRQISPEGHVLVGDLTNAYIDWQLCELEHDRAEIRVSPLPRVSGLVCQSVHLQIQENGAYYIVNPESSDAKMGLQSKPPSA